jgi:hypothetical protein
MVTKSSQTSFQANSTSLSQVGASDCVSFQYSLQLSSGSCGKIGTFGSSGILHFTGLLDGGTNTLKVTAVVAVGLRQAIPATHVENGGTCHSSTECQHYHGSTGGVRLEDCYY